MADIEISDLDPAGTLTDSDVFPLVQTMGGTPTGPFRATLLALAGYVRAFIGANGLGFTAAALNETRATAIASAATTDIGAAPGNLVHITGVTGITALGTVQAGTRREVVFDGILVLTHHATSLILPGAANLTTAAGDTATFHSEGGGNWRCTKYLRANGQAIAAGAVGGESISEPVTALGASGAIAIDLALGDYFTTTLTGNMTGQTFSNPPAAGKAQTIMVAITQDGTGNRTAAWNAAIKWPGGVAGVLSTAAGAKDLLALTTFDQGTTYYASLAKGFA
jgi:hypothetical protein